MPSTEKVELVRFNNAKAIKQEAVEGPSPYSKTTTEGPSYIKPEDRQAPLKTSGLFDEKYGKHRTDSTPLLGSDFSREVRLTEIIKNPELVKELAIIIAERGVVWFRDQDDLTVEQQKNLINDLGLLTGKPKTSRLHKHPTSSAGGVVHGESKYIDPEVSFISSRLQQSFQGRVKSIVDGNKYASKDWHSDITFEPVPADFTSLKLVELPEKESGGDTLWANGYALLEKFSPSFRSYLESLTGTYGQYQFGTFSDQRSFDLFTQARGAPENTGNQFVAVHPVVRTNPVTGWKTLFAAGINFDHFNDVSPIESALLKKFILDTLVNSHDIQVRFKSKKNDIAI